jgi:hypothetical protein
LIMFWEARARISVMMLPMPFSVFIFSYGVFSWLFFYIHCLNKYEEFWWVLDLSAWVSTVLQKRSFLRKVSSTYPLMPWAYAIQSTPAESDNSLSWCTSKEHNCAIWIDGFKDRAMRYEIRFLLGCTLKSIVVHLLL